MDSPACIEIPGVSDANAILEELGQPGTLYFIAQTDSAGNQNYITTRANPTTAAVKLVLIASEPSCAPTTLERSSCSSSFNPPIRLALGIILSMFTALLITKFLLNALHALGVQSPKAYGVAKEKKTLQILSRQKVFFGISIAVILAGFVVMGVNQASGKSVYKASDKLAAIPGT